MNNQNVFIITVLLNFSLNLIQDIQESDGTQLFIYPIIRVILCILALAKNYIIKETQCNSLFWNVVKNFLILMILGYEEDYNQDIEKFRITFVKYILLGIFFGNIIYKHEQIMGWDIAIEKSLYSLQLILTLTFNNDKNEEINYSFLFYLVLLAFPQFINQIILTKKSKNIQKKQLNKTQISEQVNQGPQQHEMLRIQNINHFQNENLSNTIRKEESQNILVKQNKADIFCYQEDNDFQRIHSLKQIEHELTPLFDTKNTKTFEFYQKFYSLFQKHFADGVIFLDKNENIIYVNKSMYYILGMYTKNQMLLKLFDLKNCHDEFQEEMQFKQLFRGLNSKLSKKIPKQFEDFESDETDSPDENEYDQQDQQQNKLSEQSVRIEYLKALTAAQAQFFKQSNVSQFSQDNSFIFKKQNKNYYKSKFICRLGSQQQNIEDDENNEKQFKEQNDDQNKLLEISLKSLIFNNQPCVQIIARDVTLFNRFTVIKKINQNKSKMLSQVTHEFRQPLNIIISFTQNCMETYVSNQILCEQFLQPIFTSASQLLSLVNDLLDLAQLKAGKFSIINQDFDLNKLISDIQKLLLPQATVRNLYLIFNNGIDIPPFINSDPNRIRQIIINLISNSLKFTIKGGIIINVSNEGLNYYKISVIDSGIGIGIEDQPRLFQAFGKIEGSNHLNQQGVGLGLMISHVIAQKLSQSYKDEITQGLNAYSAGKTKGSQFDFLVFDQSQKSRSSYSIESKYQSSCISKSLNFDLSNFSISQPNLIQTSIQVINILLIIKDIQNFQNITKEIQIEKGNICLQIQQNSVQSQNSIMMVKQTSKNQKYITNSRTQKLKPIDINIKGESLQNFSPKGFDNIQQEIETTKYWMNQCYCKEILLVDDEPFIIQAVSYTLKKQNLKFISVKQIIILYQKKANSCEQTIKLLIEIKNQSCCQWIRIILIDIEMPIQDGFQTTIQIREMEKEIQHMKNFRPAYIIGCSGHGDNIKQNCLDKGMNDYLSKPVNKQKLFQIIEDQIFDIKNGQAIQQN